jgi:hypothetical protein
MSQTYSDKTRRAIRKYGIEACIGAYNLHRHEGWGSRGISCEGGFPILKTTRQADAAIDAGREIHVTAEIVALCDYGVMIGDRVEAGVGDDHDTGRVVRILTATTCEVAWDSGVRTPAAIIDLKRLEA